MPETWGDTHRLTVATGSRSWEWLSSLAERLRVDLQLVDADYAPIPLPPVPQPSRISELLGTALPALRSAIGTALRGSTPLEVTIDDLHIACCAVATSTGDPAALIVARPAPAGGQPRGELSLIARWLAPAIGAHLQSPVTTEAESLRRVSAMLTVLAAASVPGSDRSLVTSFADTLAIWHDIELTGYVELADGTFQREVVLPGADRQKLPDVLSGALLPPAQDDAVLVRSDPNRLNLDISEDVLIARLGPERQSWLLLLCGASIPPNLLPRLEVYTRVLGEWLTRATAESQNRVSGALFKTLFHDAADPKISADRAIAELRRLAGASAATLTLGAAPDQVLFQAGDAQIPVDATGAFRRVTNAVTPDVAMTLAVHLPPGRRFTPQERAVVDASADLFTAWARRVIQEPAARRERRVVARRFDEVVDRYVRQALDQGVSVAVVVLSFARPQQSDQLHTLVTEIRGLLRFPDLVGTLGPSEVALLLHDVSSDRVTLVVERVRQALEAVAPAGRPLVAATGIAFRQAGMTDSGGSVQEARAHALARDVA